VELESKKAGEVIQGIIKEATPENIRRMDFLRPNFADEDGRLRAVVQAFLVKSSGKNILVDTCCGHGKTRTDVPEWGNLRIGFVQESYRLGVKKTDIDYVVCTHLHFDHVGGNTISKDGKWVPTFANAEYIFVREEYEYWEGGPEGEIDDDRAAFVDSVEPVMTAGLGRLVEEDYRLDDNVRLVPTKGHTPGHVSVAIESGGEKAVITGDALHHPCQVAHPEWSTEADWDKDLAVASRKKMLEGVAGGGVLLIGSHFADPAAGYVVESKDNGTNKNIFIARK